MARAFFALSFITLLLGACTQRMVCPAYQSAFIYDKEELRKKFSYFQEDSTPKIFTASKNKYLIAEPTSYRKKVRSLQTVPMKPVNVVLPDSFNIGEPGEPGEDGVVVGAELDLAARSVIDSTYIEDVDQGEEELTAEDSVYVITVDKEIRVLKYNVPDTVVYDPATGKYVAQKPKYVVTQITFNVEQDNYMWYLRDYLVLPDVRLAKEGNAAAAKAAKKSKKKGGFFKNLFKKKDKKAAATDSTAVQAPADADDDFDYVDEDEQQAQAQPAQEQPQKKKGPFSFLKKKDKEPQPQESVLPDDEQPAKKKKEKKPKKVKEEEANPDEEKKKEEADDGF